MGIKMCCNKMLHCWFLCFTFICQFFVEFCKSPLYIVEACKTTTNLVNKLNLWKICFSLRVVLEGLHNSYMRLSFRSKDVTLTSSLGARSLNNRHNCSFLFHKHRLVERNYIKLDSKLEPDANQLQHNLKPDTYTMLTLL